MPVRRGRPSSPSCPPSRAPPRARGGPSRWRRHARDRARSASGVARSRRAHRRRPWRRSPLTPRRHRCLAAGDPGGAPPTSLRNPPRLPPAGGDAATPATAVRRGKPSDGASSRGTTTDEAAPSTAAPECLAEGIGGDPSSGSPAVPGARPSRRARPALRARERPRGDSSSTSSSCWLSSLAAAPSGLRVEPRSRSPPRSRAAPARGRGLRGVLLFTRRRPQRCSDDCRDGEDHRERECPAAPG